MVLETLRYRSFDHAKPWLDEAGHLVWSRGRARLAKVIYTQCFETTMGAIIMLHFGLILFEADQDARCFPPRFHGSYDLCPFRCSALLWHQAAGLRCVVDCFLLVIYSSEFLARFYVERRRYFCSAWNMVDFTTLAVGWPCFLFGSRLNLNVLRLFRCIRTLRAGRIFISVPELYLLVTGLSSSIKAMFFGSLLLVAALVFWAVIAVEEGFAGIFAATVTLFQQVVVSDAWGEISLPLLQAKSWTAVVLFPIAVTISLGVMNLILAVIVERAAQGRDKDHERKIKQKELGMGTDQDSSGALSLEEMLQGYDRNEDFQKRMQVMDVKREDMQTIFRVLDSDDSGEVSYLEFCQHLGSFSARDPVKYSVMELRKWMAEDAVFASITDVSARQPPTNSSQVATQLSWMGQQKRLSSRQQKLRHTLRQLQSMRYKMILGHREKALRFGVVRNEGSQGCPKTSFTAKHETFNIDKDRRYMPWAGKVEASVPAFESCMGLVILINFGFIVFESDRDSKCYPDYAGRYDACPERSELLEWLRLVNLTLLSVYTLEALCRAFVERSQYFCNRWNVVDLLAVLLGWPTVLSLGSGNLHLLRMVRFVRLIRALRVIISVPELYLLVTGFSSSIKAIIFGSLLLVAALVFWAVIAVEVLHPIISVLPYPDCGNCSAGFSGIFAATVTLFQQMVMGDAWGAISLPLIEAAPWTFPVLFVMMMTVSLGAMNLILAVIVERAAQGRDKDQERKIKQKEEERSKNMIDLAVLCATMDEDNSGSLSLVEMLHGYDRNEEFRKLMQVMDIKRDDMQTIFRVLDSDDSGEVSYFEFCQHLGSFLERDPVVMHSLVKFSIMELRKLMKEDALGILHLHTRLLQELSLLGSESFELQKRVQETDQELGRLLHRARELLDALTNSFDYAAQEVQVPDGSRRDLNELQENPHRRLVEEQFESLCSHFEARAHEAEHLKQGCLEIQKRLQQVGCDVKEGRCWDKIRVAQKVTSDWMDPEESAKQVEELRRVRRQIRYIFGGMIQSLPDASSLRVDDLMSDAGTSVSQHGVKAHHQPTEKPPPLPGKPARELAYQKVPVPPQSKPDHGHHAGRPRPGSGGTELPGPLPELHNPTVEDVTVQVQSSPVLNEDGVAASEPPEKGSFTVKLELEELKPRMLGVLSKYNEKFPRQAIRKFDKITAVNGKVGNANDLRRTPHHDA
eukprot:s423_g4.t2